MNNGQSIYLITVIICFPLLGFKMFVGLAVEQGISGLIYRECERGKSIHYEIGEGHKNTVIATNSSYS